MGGAVEDAVLHIMMPGPGIGGDHQHLVPQLYQTIPQNLHMGDHPVDVGEIGFGKQRDPHSFLTSLANFPYIFCLLI